MRIYNSRSYVTENSDLQMFIIKIQYENTDYVKFKGILSNKRNGYVYETKNYKLPRSQISHWLDLDSLMKP